ncbi:MAG: DegV family protein [Oscillospiraceae bacterium]|nr:DegV family protein [Oscillospiraceae bacterium]
MEDIKIVIDSGADMPPELAEKYGIGVIPFLSLFGEEQYVHGVDITNEEFFDKLESFDGFPTTSQTPYADMYDYFLEESGRHKSVIYFALSSAASGQYQTANMVRNEILEEANPDADIRIVDSQKFSLYIAQTAVHAVELARAGKSVDEIIEDCEKYILSWRCYLLVDTLKYLEKGGRLSKTAAFVGTMLNIKPILTIEHGLVENMDKLRGNKRLIDKLIDRVKEDSDFDSENPRFLIVQSDNEKGEEACAKLRAEFGDDCITMYGGFGPLIGTHVGKGAIAVIAGIKA